MKLKIEGSVESVPSELVESAEEKERRMGRKKESKAGRRAIEEERERWWNEKVKMEMEKGVYVCV